jgi:hypothetical protein
MSDKLFSKSKERFVFEINGKGHKITVKASPFSRMITILIDDNAFIHEKIKGRKDHIFYPLNIDGAPVVVELVKVFFSYDKNLYVNSVSINTGIHIDGEKDELRDRIDKGFVRYVYSKIVTEYKRILIFFCIFLYLMPMSCIKKIALLYAGLWR